MPHRALLRAALVAALLAGCSSSPPAQVSKDELASVRQSHAGLVPGMPKGKALDSFKAGNKVKLGSAMIGGASIEEWKVEAFHDHDSRKDLFVTFLYFRNDVLVDSSDSRINFRENSELLERWQGSAR